MDILIAAVVSSLRVRNALCLCFTHIVMCFEGHVDTDTVDGL